jgi:subtilisin-like proprotein convertase family protein
MKKYTARTRIRLVALAGLLALPLTAAPAVRAKPRARIVTRTYSNAAAVMVPVTAPSSAPVSAGLYPSTILVSGLRRGRIRDVNLSLNGLSHHFPGDLEVLLVGPGGQTAVVMGNIGGAGDVTGVTLHLDDEAAVPLPADPGGVPLPSGIYRPMDSSNGIVFNTPAPPAGANAALSVFDGTNPNGTWRLFVQNQFGSPVPVGFAGGWSIELVVHIQLPAKRRKRKRPHPRRNRGAGDRSTS